MLTHRIVRAVLLTAVLLLSRGQLTYASAAANWNPAFDDPNTIDATDICGLIAKSISHSDPMDEVRRSLLLALRPIGEAPTASTTTADDYTPRAHRPRAPPSV
jgi:hypothetical protein